MQHLYISYPKSDYALAHRLVDDLQAAGYAVFVDAVSNAGSPAWAAETRRAIRASGAVIMILSLAKRRRVGIRHEGILAKRRNKPVFVLARSPGSLPRYLLGATVIDFSGDYGAALQQLLAALPDADTLLNAPAFVPRRGRRAGYAPRQRRRRRIGWWAGLLAVLMICVAMGIVVGLIPV